MGEEAGVIWYTCYTYAETSVSAQKDQKSSCSWFSDTDENRQRTLSVEAQTGERPQKAYGVTHAPKKK